MHTHTFAIILGGVFMPVLALASSGNMPAQAMGSMHAEARVAGAASAVLDPSAASWRTQTAAPVQLSQADVRSANEQSRQDYQESVTHEAAQTDPAGLQPPESGAGPAPAAAAPAPGTKKEAWRVNAIRGIVSEALSAPRVEKVDVDTARISPPAGGERRQQLQEAVDAAPRPQDSPGDDYISVLKDEVSTTVVVDEAVVLPAQTGASPAARAGQRAYVYTVRNGDSLWIIAKRVYGDGLRWARIFDANRDTVANADILEVGQRLKIPKE